jgi:hypothetical protein
VAPDIELRVWNTPEKSEREVETLEGRIFEVDQRH